MLIADYTCRILSRQLQQYILLAGEPSPALRLLSCFPVGPIFLKQAGGHSGVCGAWQQQLICLGRLWIPSGQPLWGFRSVAMSCGSQRDPQSFWRPPRLCFFNKGEQEGLIPPIPLPPVLPCVLPSASHTPFASSHCSPTSCCLPRVTSGTVDWAQGHGGLQLQDWLPWTCCSLGSHSRVQLRCLAQGHQGEKGGEVPPLKPEQLHSRELKEQNVNQE